MIREAAAAHGGVEVDTQGDAFLIAFSSARSAVQAAVEAQRALAPTRVHVRMGIHTGEPSRTDEGYVGVDLHRGARLMSEGHGGQVLLSQTARDLLDDLPVRDLGAHRLKDLSEPQHLYQLLADGLESEFPPPAHARESSYKPAGAADPACRPRARAGAASRAGRRADARCVTLTGPGGTGKTRLALQAAAELVDRYPQGAWFVNLAALTHAELVVPAIAQTLGLKERPAETMLETLASEVSEKEMLLVLDNFEHVEEAGPALAELLAGAPKLKALVMSRSPLHLSGEWEYPVSPLEADQALALFAERAQRAKPGFVLDGNRLLVGEICGRLDNLPLAIELAAARIKMLPERALLERLDQKLSLLTGGARDRDERQRTLRAAIDWSYSLLSESEKTLFRRLAVFAGGRSMDAIEAVCGDPDSFDAFDAVASLVDKSLLRQDETSDGEPRFVMLETLHEYARERLDESGEGDEIRRRHADYFCRLAKTLFNEWGDSHDPQGHVRFAREQDNFRAALSTLIDARSAQVLGLTRRLWGSWLFRGQLDEGQRWVRGALDAATDAEPEERAWMLGVLGEFPRFRGEHASALEIKEEALAAGRALSLDRAIKATLCDMAESLAHNGDLDRAKALVQEALEIEAGSGDSRQTRAQAGGRGGGHGERRLRGGSRSLRANDRRVPPAQGPGDDGLVLLGPRFARRMSP